MKAHDFYSNASKVRVDMLRSLCQDVFDVTNREFRIRFEHHRDNARDIGGCGAGSIHHRGVLTVHRERIGSQGVEQIDCNWILRVCASITAGRNDRRIIIRRSRSESGI